VSKRPASLQHEIEITPEMIAAGIEEYALFDFFDPGEWVVCAIYRAMAAKARSSQIGVLSGADADTGVVQQTE
jgi:hypothetical protein